MKLSSLTPDSRNANKGTPRGRKMVQDSLRKYGAGRSILLDKNGHIIAGNKTAEGAKAIGLEDVQVVKTDGTKLIAVQRTDLDINDRKARELAIADNRAAEVGLEWDPEVLKSLETEDVDLSGFWDERELVSFLATIPKGAPNPKSEIAAELLSKWNVRRGQVWRIAKHKIMCGDAASLDDVRFLFEQRTANVVFTSPPYFEQRQYEGASFDWNLLMRGVSEAIPSNENTQVLVNLGLVHRDCEWIPYWSEWLDHMKTLSWRRFGIYVWDQGSGLPGDWMGRLAPSFEFVFHFNRERLKPNKIIPTKPESQEFRAKKDALRHPDGRVHSACSPELYGQDHKIPDSVIRINREAARGIHTEGHPAVFPVDLPKFVIEAWSQPEEICYEPFCGSGTTICAAEQCDRRCYAMEIEPKYVAVALQRLFDMGLQPVLSDA